MYSISLPNNSYPVDIEVDPGAQRAYVVNNRVDNVSVINTVTDTVVEIIDVGSDPRQIALDPNANRAYVSNYGSGTVSVIDTTSNTVIETITVGPNPIGIAFAKVFIPSTVTTIDLNLNANWNLVSLPVVPTNSNLTYLFPDAEVAYKFDGTYQLVTTVVRPNK